MKADPSRQARLLDLQALDTQLAQLAHRSRTLPEHAEINAMIRELDDLESEAVRTATERSDIQRELTKAEAAVQLVRDRATRDQARLDSGSGSAKDLQALQHELASLARRQGALEDEELEVMERAETAQADAVRAEQARDRVRAAVDGVIGRRDDKVGEIEAQEKDVLAGRQALVDEVGADLIALYDRIRAQRGTGAAALVARRCGGCQLELNRVDLDRLAAAADDDVQRCEECGRILVRTNESGV